MANEFSNKHSSATRALQKKSTDCPGAIVSKFSMKCSILKSDDFFFKFYGIEEDDFEQKVQKHCVIFRAFEILCCFSNLVAIIYCIQALCRSQRNRVGRLDVGENTRGRQVREAGGRPTCIPVPASPRPPRGAAVGAELVSSIASPGASPPRHGRSGTHGWPVTA